MEYVRLGGTGLRVSRACLGMMSFGRDDVRPWGLDEETSEPIVRRAVEGGVTFFDTADVYAGGDSEVITGRLLSRFFGTREEYVVATKVFAPTMPGPNGQGLSRKHILASIDASLQRLGLDYVDLYQVHSWDDSVPVEETMDALHDVVRSGKVRYIGACNMFAWQFAKAQAVAPTRFVSFQTHYNLLYREEEREVIPQCIDQGAGVLAWSPLARGRLARALAADGQATTERAQTDAFATQLYDDALDAGVIARVGEIAESRGVSRAQVALAWLLHQPGVTAPIVGATKTSHVDDALAAEQLTLDADALASLDDAYAPHFHQSRAFTRKR